MKIYIVGKEKLFNSSEKENIGKYGEIIFLDSNNYIDNITNDSSKKVVVYDPDFGGWKFPKEIL